jgi:type I site-specific deoxyribonuclease, hsdR family
MNLLYEEMKDLFANAGISDMEKLPEDVPAKAKFAKLFREFNNYLQAARIQGFQWDRKEYIFSKDSEDGDILSIQEGDRELKEKRRGEIKELEIKEIDYLEEIKLALQKETQEERDKGSASLEAEETKKEVLSLLPSEDIFRIMVQRYKELRPRAKDKEDGEITFPIDPYLTEENTGVIDHEYMNSRFQKWKKVLEDPNADPKLLESTLAELHKSFAFLSQEDQKYANLFLHDVQTGDAKLSEELSFQDYIVRYAKDEKSEQIKKVVQYLGISEKMLSDMLRENITEDNLNEYGRFDALKETVDRNKAQDYFSKIEGETLPPFMVNNRIEKLLTDFIFSGGFAILSPEKDAE